MRKEHSRAVHFELTCNMVTKEFLSALRRIITEADCVTRYQAIIKQL